MDINYCCGKEKSSGEVKVEICMSKDINDDDPKKTECKTAFFEDEKQEYATKECAACYLLVV